MPTSARKSSLGAAARRQKAHIPYRGDNPGVGKKTGIPVAEVDGYVRTLESWVEAMNGFDYWALWGKEALTAELYGCEGKIKHLVSDV